MRGFHPLNKCQQGILTTWTFARSFFFIQVTSIPTFDLGLILIDFKLHLCLSLILFQYMWNYLELALIETCENAIYSARNILSQKLHLIKVPKMALPVSICVIRNRFALCFLKYTLPLWEVENWTYYLLHNYLRDQNILVGKS